MGSAVLPSLLVKLKYVNDLLAEGRCSGPGQERAIFTWGWVGQYLSILRESLTVLYCINVLYLTLHSSQTKSLIPLTAL